MENIRCCVIDDEPLAAKLIANYVERTPFLSLQFVCNSASDAIRHILDDEVDLVFLDIEMPQIGGIEFARIIPPKVRVVFTTAYDRYAVDGFRVNALDYLLKPVSYEEFLASANRAMHSLAEHHQQPTTPQAPRREFLIVKSGYKHVQIRISDILVVEGLKDYIKIYVEGQKRAILTLMSMKAIEQSLPADTFMRVHRSYIVNTACISVIDRNQVMVGTHTVPVSDTYRERFAQYIASLNPDPDLL